MRAALIASVLAAAALPAEAAPRGKPAAGPAVMGPGWIAPGSKVRVHRGSGAARRPLVVAVQVRPPAPQVVVIRRSSRFAYPGYAFAYPVRDWTAERFGQSDWSGGGFGSSDFGRGPWGDYGPD